jgi:hypothetical protein
VSTACYGIAAGVCLQNVKSDGYPASVEGKLAVHGGIPEKHAEERRRSEQGHVMTPDIGLGNWLSQRARRTPQRLALTFEGMSWTYAALQERIDYRPTANGVCQGDRVGFLGFWVARVDRPKVSGLRCERCGHLGANARPNWNERRPVMVAVASQAPPDTPAAIDRATGRTMDSMRPASVRRASPGSRLLCRCCPCGSHAPGAQARRRARPQSWRTAPRRPPSN